jgi:hypothetical protein
MKVANIIQSLDSRMNIKSGRVKLRTLKIIKVNDAQIERIENYMRERISPIFIYTLVLFTKQMTSTIPPLSSIFSSIPPWQIECKI